MNDVQCKQQESIAYNSCVDSYYHSKNRNDIYEYWLYLFEAGRYCEAVGVQKALELIDIIIDLDINGKT